MAVFHRPVFIVGSPRSGTTLMRSIVDAHTQIFCPFWETGFFIHFDALLSSDLDAILAKDKTFPINRDFLINWARGSVETLLARFGESAGKHRWAEKTPAHVYHMDLIKEVFPDAQFIHMIRNANDVIRSLQNMPWAPKNINWAIDRWNSSIEAGQSSGARMSPTEYCEIRYEQLLAEPSETVTKLCEFLGERFEPSMLEFHSEGRNSWRTSLAPLQTKSLNNYSDLGLLSKTLVRWKTRNLMRALGYTNAKTGT